MPGGVAAFRYLHEVSRFVADLAVRVGGSVAAPMSGETLAATGAADLAARGVTSWLGSGDPTDGPPVASGLQVKPLDPIDASVEDVDSGIPGRGGFAGVQALDRTRRVHTFSAENLDLATGRLSAALRPPPPGGGGRHVVLHWRSLEDVGERLLISWAVHSGAAIVLVPPSLGVLYALHWCRPTVLQGTSSELARLAGELEELDGPLAGRKQRRRFRRLEAVVVLDEPAEVEAHERWRCLGAVLVSLPELVGSGRNRDEGLPREGELPDNVAW